eukprot:TRINITY_DN30372_c0_g1_i1.p1 TRINITY_DN30372_c0_g1~~TRINITY_DN30372_c0_g1_i1.p1  ORF type:complete len:226 (+),score=58.92 TRINITY_DN30372_c0_g1_i1:255-932(+)
MAAYACTAAAHSNVVAAVQAFSSPAASPSSPLPSISCRLPVCSNTFLGQSLHQAISRSARPAGDRKANNRRQICASAANDALSPAAQFYKIEAIIRPWRLQFVAKELLKMGIRGVTVSDVRGFGAQGGSRERQAGSEFTDDNLVVKVKLEVVVIKDQVEEVVDCIIAEAATGEIGDGKIFISPVAEIIRVRTGERGIPAETMAGGRQELLSRAHNGSMASLLDGN